MATYLQQIKKAIIGLTAASTAAMMVSCMSTRSSSPKQVDISNPTVTYQYLNDDQLVEASQRAMKFCEGYRSLPQAQSFSVDSENHRIVIFECVPNLQETKIVQVDFPLRYDYHTDQQLLQLSRDAQLYCLNSGKPQMKSDIVVASNSSSTVTFECSP